MDVMEGSLQCSVSRWRRRLGHLHLGRRGLVDVGSCLVAITATEFIGAALFSMYFIAVDHAGNMNRQRQVNFVRFAYREIAKTTVRLERRAKNEGKYTNTADIRGFRTRVNVNYLNCAAHKATL